MSKNIYTPSFNQIKDLIWEDYDPGPYSIPQDARDTCSYFDWTGKKFSKEHKKALSESNKKPKTGVALVACLKNAKLGAIARTGMKDSYEVKRKRAASVSKALAGKPKIHKRKFVIIDGNIYKGVELVQKKFNITRQTVYNRIKSDKWNWKYASTK